MNRFALTALSGSLVLSGLSFACSGAPGPDPTSTPTAAAAGGAVSVDVAREPVAPTTHGRVKRIGEALGQVDLRADQRAQLEALAADAEARQVTVLATRQELGAALAGQITRGALDRDALSAKVSAVVDAMSDSQPKDRAAFEAVHAILDPGQRAAFAVAMETTGHGSHLAGMMMKGLAERGQEWAAGLGLSEEQHAAIETIFREAHHWHPEGAGHRDGPRGFMHGEGHGRGVLEAFKADTFSFDAVSPPEDLGAKVSGMTDHMLDVVDKALPILTPAQRVLAADKVQRHMEDMPFGHGI
jgi:Spy/CpxP family protein refolding chaperone